MNGHTVLWSSPSPLWGRFRDPAGDATFQATDQARPAILRFATDDFMEQVLSTLASEPRQLGALVARPETWRAPAGDAPTLIERAPVPRLVRSLARLRKNEAVLSALDGLVAEQQVKEHQVTRTLPLKLYQPAHQRYYLVAANLVCALPGFPDRALATGGHDQVGFVLRRLLVPKDAVGDARAEFAFVKDDAGAHWHQVTSDGPSSDPVARLEDGEERLPLFPLNFRDDVAHPRRLLAGMIPVGRREEYMSSRAQHLSANGSPSITGTPATDLTARKEQFKLEVSEPWKNLVRTAYRGAVTVNDTEAGTVSNIAAKQQAAVKALNDQLQGQSWLLLLDFADYLSVHLPRVWAWVANEPNPPSPLTTPEQRLLNWLNTSQTLPGTSWPITAGTPVRAFATTLGEALRRIRGAEAVRTRLEGATRSYPAEVQGQTTWPDYLYLVAGIRDSKVAAGVHSTLSSVTGVASVDPSDKEAAALGGSATFRQIEEEARTLDKLVQLVIGAIDLQQPSAPAPAVPFASQLRDALKTTNGDPGWFVLRCVYLRPDCGPLHPAVVSAPSQRFQLASFFDPDAPARPIRIALPVDTTPAGLRKHNKNTAFMLSDVLCGQVQRAKGLGFGDLVMSVLPWPFHKDLDIGGDGIGPCESGPNASLGMICSLSIPIITICALILLMMIVLILDLIFKWIPWFIICFPLPGFKAKK